MTRRTTISVGDRFGRLEVVAPHFREKRPGSKQARSYVPCRCDCGVDTVVAWSDLKSGNTTSCNCFKIENTKRVNSTHKESKTRLHVTWCSMKARCYNPKVKGYPNWGGRGIVICEEWLRNYESFASWARSNGYADNLTIDRIDNDGNYEPSNCRWITKKEQMQNTSKNRKVTAFGETKNLSQWAEDPRAKADIHTIYGRITNHWIPEDAISTEVWGRPERSRQIRDQVAASSSIITQNEIDREIWLSIPGWPIYDVSDLGRIRSYWKEIGSGKSKDPAKKRRVVVGIDPKILKPYLKKDGPLVINLFNEDRKPSMMIVARLVLMAHVGPAPERMQACHFPDPNPSNCRLTNLRWDTPGNNNRDKSRVNELVLSILTE